MSTVLLTQERDEEGRGTSPGLLLNKQEERIYRFPFQSAGDTATATIRSAPASQRDCIAAVFLHLRLLRRRRWLPIDSGTGVPVDTHTRVVPVSVPCDSLSFTCVSPSALIIPDRCVVIVNAVPFAPNGLASSSAGLYVAGVT